MEPAEAEQIERVMRWWLSHNDNRVRRAAEVGGIDEVIQEAFLRLLRSPPPTGLQFSTIACKTVCWTLADMYRNHAKDCHLLIDSDQLHAVWTEIDLTERLHQQDAQDAVRKAISELPPRSAAFLMYRLDGKTDDEIAEICGVSKHGIQKNVCRSISRLRQPEIVNRLARFVDQ